MDNLDNDNFFGKRAKARRAARRAARKAGKSRKEARGLGRLAKRKVKSAQLRKRGKIKRADRVIARGTTSGLKIVLQNAALAPLLPFRKVMSKVLSKRGLFTKGMSFPNVVNAFFNNIVSKKNNPSSKFDEVSDNYISSHNSANMYLEDVETKEDYDNFVGAIGNIVSAIINFFKKKKDERKAKKSQSSEDAMIGEEALVVEEQLIVEAENSKPITREDIKNAAGSEKRALRKMFRVQKKSDRSIDGAGLFGGGVSRPQQPRQAGFLSGLTNILGGVQNQRLQQQQFQNQRFNRMGGMGGNPMLPKIIGVVAIAILAFVIFRQVGK